VAQSKALEFPQKRTLNIIFPDGEYATNLTIAIESLQQISQSWFSDYEFGGGMALWPPLDPPLFLSEKI